jgi:tetratricopeptide (TPR) repeat protein
LNDPGLLEDYRERLGRLSAELDTVEALAPVERVRVRDEIVALFRDLERTIAELEVLKSGVRPLVDRYKQIFPRGAEAAQPLRVDHLGSSTYRERGWSALAGADYPRAVRELEKAVGLDPDNAANLCLLAWAYLRQDDLVRARSLLDQVLARQPNHPLGRTNFGYLRFREGSSAEAIENLAVVVRDGTDATATLYANLYLGIVYSERDMHRDAQTFFRRTLSLGPNLTEAYWELGRSYEREGRIDLALETWRAGATNRFSPWGERCRAAVERLEASATPATPELPPGDSSA